MALNKITIMGRITQDISLRKTPSGVSTVSFSIACERDFKNKETGEKQTDFFNCTAWRATADFISQYFSKGRVIIIDGRLQREDYEGKDGVKRQNVFINVENAYFGDSKHTNETQSAGTSYATPASSTASAPVTDDFLSFLPSGDDLPF